MIEWNEGHYFCDQCGLVCRKGDGVIPSSTPTIRCLANKSYRCATWIDEYASDDHESDGARYGRPKREREPTPAGGTNPKDKLGQAKPMLHLVPTAGLLYVAEVMRLGAEKYGPYNWRDNAVLSTVYHDAAERHLRSSGDGERDDRESGWPHMAHVAACALIWLDAFATGNLVDDLPTPGRAADLIEEMTARRRAALREEEETKDDDAGS